jgi:hypothetical protein
MSSSKPIEDEIQVREVGESSRVNKIDINSQSLPLPPMTVNQFEDAVANIAKEIIDFGKPTESIDISNLSTNSESISTTQIDDISSEINKVSQAQVPVTPVPAPASPAAAPEPAKAEDPETTLSGIESAIAELLSKLDSVKGSSSGGGGGGDLTTRDYVDQVLGGERNLEGENLVEVANFVGKEDGISLRQEEDGSFTKIQDGEVVQEDMTQREANDLVQELEQKDTEKNDEATAAVAQKEDTANPEVEATIEKDVDVATEESKPFSFSSEHMIYMTFDQPTPKVFAKTIFGSGVAGLLGGILSETASNGYWYLDCTVSNGVITSIEVKADKAWIAYDLEGYCTFTGTGADREQTGCELPIATGFQGQLNLISTGGFYQPTTFCVNGTPIVYPMKLA